MQLQQLKYVLEIAKTGSMNKASHNLFISQPNLSSAISNLEKELDITIFNRTNKGVEITSEGKLLLKYAKSILGQVDQLKSIYNTDNKEEISTIEVSQSKHLYLSSAINSIYNNLDGNTIKLTLNQCGVSDVIKEVYNMKSEIGIITISNVQQNILDKILDQKKLEFTEINNSQVCIIVGENSSIYTKEKVTIEEILNLTYIGYLEENASTIKYSVELSEIWSDFSSNSIHVNDQVVLIDLLYSLDSYSFDLNINKEYLESKKLKCITLKDKIDIKIGWIKRKKEALSAEAKLFVDEVNKLYGYNKKL